MFPDIVHVLKSWLESATKSEKAVADRGFAVFKGKDALGKTLKYSSKERDMLNAHQHQEQQDNAGSAMAVLNETNSF